MARRVVTSDRAAETYDESSVVVRPSAASVIARILTVIYVTVISVIGVDTLLRALDARRSNGFVSVVRDLASPLEAPFRGIVANQRYWATALIAAVVYTIGYLITAVLLGRDWE